MAACAGQARKILHTAASCEQRLAFVCIKCLRPSPARAGLQGNSRGDCYAFDAESGERVGHLPAARISGRRESGVGRWLWLVHCAGCAATNKRYPLRGWVVTAARPLLFLCCSAGAGVWAV